MLRAWTINVARQDFAEEWTVSIEPGKVADLVVLDGDLVQAAADPHEITSIGVDLTVFDGGAVHER